MRRLELTEHGHLDDVEIADAEAAALSASGAVTMRLSGARRWEIQASATVGVVRHGSLELWVHPKVPVSHLLFLLLYARNADGWRSALAAMQTSDDIVVALAGAFEHQARAALARGVLQGYVRVERSEPVLRGRFRASEQLRRRFGIAVPVEIAYDEFTTDIPENRILRSAARRLLRHADLPARARAGLRHLDAQLADVGEIAPGQAVPAIRRTRLNAHYDPAVRLGRLILEHTSLRVASGAHELFSMLFDMNRVFEDFVTAALGRDLTRPGFTVRQQDRNRTLDVGGRIDLRPDLVLYCGAKPATIIDAKYKVAADDKPSHADLYQLLAYCVAFGIDVGYLVYPGAGAERAHVVRNLGTSIRMTRLDLSLEPDRLLQRVRALAEAIWATSNASAAQVGVTFSGLA